MIKCKNCDGESSGDTTLNL